MLSQKKKIIIIFTKKKIKIKKYTIDFKHFKLTIYCKFITTLKSQLASF